MRLALVSATRRNFVLLRLLILPVLVAVATVAGESFRSYLFVEISSPIRRAKYSAIQDSGEVPNGRR